jgi:hypothetical protein
MVVSACGVIAATGIGMLLTWGAAAAEVQETPFFYRPELVARARANAAKYTWAKTLMEAKSRAARRWAGWGDDRLLAFVPVVTPMRPCDCPNCGKPWRGYIWSWDPNRPDEIVCRWCRTSTTPVAFRDNDVLICKDPQGVDRKLPCYRDAKGKRHFIRSRLAYHKLCYAAKVAMALAEGFVLTGERALGRKAIVLMRRLGEVYPGYVLKDWKTFGETPWGLAGKVSGWHYQDAIVVGGLARAYDALRCAGLVTADDAKVIEDGLFRKAGELLIAVPPSRGCVNDIPHRFAGVTSIARVLGDRAIMNWAMNDETGFETFVQSKWLPDGHWCERSPSYDMMSLSNLHLTPWVMLGYTSSGAAEPMDLRTIPLIKRINTALFDIVWPDGTLPAMSDSHVGARPRETLAEINYAWYGGQDRLAFLVRAYGGKLLERGDEFAFWHRRPDIDAELKRLDLEPLPARPSIHLPHLGITLLRGGEGATRTVVMLDHGKWADGHCHYDRLGIIVWARGREMASDLGYVYAAHPLRHRWMVHTLAHNTVVVDGESQARPGQARPVFVRLGGPVQAIEAAAVTAYPKKVTAYRRTIAMLARAGKQPLVCDVFRVRGGATHDWSYHAETGQLTLEGVSLSAGQPLGDARPYRQLTDIRSGTTEGGWQATYRWPDGEGLRLWMGGAAGTVVSTVSAPGQRRKDQEGRRLPYVIVRRTGKDLASTFVCVHEPFSRRFEVSRVDVVRCDAQVNTWPVILKVDVQGKTWWVGSKLGEGSWSGLPAGVPSLPAGRFASVVN